MRLATLNTARALALAGPPVLAFFSGGYFDEPRAWAGLIAWALLAVACLLETRALPRGRAARIALGGLTLLAAWTLLSMIWAPIRGRAYHAGQLTTLYLGALLAAAVLFRRRGVIRAVEPAVVMGALIVVTYGISERLLPGWLHFARSITAQGRLNQPLTYWNAMGELAAIGLVLSARLAGDATRARWVRAAAAAAAAPLGMGLYLSFSRGALFAWGAGLVALIVAAPRREQLRGIVLTVVAGALAAVAAAPSKSVTALSGALPTREREGAIALALLATVVLISALAGWRLAARERQGALPLPRRAPWLAGAIVCVGLGLAIVVGAKESARAPLGAGASRYVSLQSNRYNYWSVALRAFAAEPVRGAGAGGWEVWWLRYRPNNEFAQDAHSLVMQTLAELGLVGLGLLVLVITGIGLAARQAHRADWALAAGPICALITWLAHQPLDWDWQLPALTLFAVVLAGALIGLAQAAEDPGSETAPVGEARAVLV